MKNLSNLQNLQSLNKGQVISAEQRLTSYITGLSGLVAYWPLNETSGNALNLAPETIGTLDGVVSGATQGVDGQFGKAYSFDGSDDDVEVNEIDQVDNLSSMTMFGLVKASAAPSTDGFFGFRNGDINDSFYVLGLNSTSVEFRFRNSAGNEFTIGASTQDVTSDWFLYTLVLDGDTLTAYQNEDVVGTPNTSVVGSFGTAEHDFYIAKDDDPGRRLNGLIQHVGILNRAMTVEEITNLVNLFF